MVQAWVGQKVTRMTLPFRVMLSYYTSLIWVLKQAISFNTISYIHPMLYNTLEDIRAKSDGPIKCTGMQMATCQSHCYLGLLSSDVILKVKCALKLT
jgi:hypothetical protein